MKTTSINNWLGAGMAVFASVMTFHALADQPSPAQAEENYTGIITSVNPQEHLLNVRGWMMTRKTFHLGDNCLYTQLDNSKGTATDLRSGEKVKVTYQDAHGVLIASQVKQEPLQYEGMVKKIDPVKHAITLHATAASKELQIADNCKIVLRDENTGTLADILPGNHVTVIYEIPNGRPMAMQIVQTSMTFTGKLTAIDLNEKTVRAKNLFDSKKFNLADNCVIVINGKLDGRLSDLRPTDKLLFSYDEIKGVNVVNRIATTPKTPQSGTTAANQPQEQPQNLGMPLSPTY